MQAPEQPAGIPYLGSRISLVSKTDIRYEGFLFNIDTRQSTVALQSVRSFGTEGRRAAHEAVPPSPHVLQYATFKAAEIKDLHVCEAAPQPPPPPPPAPQPPLPAGPPPPPAAKPTLLTPGSVTAQTQQQVQQPQPQLQQQQAQQVQQVQPEQLQQAQAQQQQQQAQQQQGQRRQAGRTIPGMGGHLLKRKERRAPGGAEPGVRPDDASGEFDFAEGLNDFDKQQEFSKMEEKKEATGSYQKSSFFDTISCDALDRLEGQRSRMSGAEERKLNTETFGAVGLNNRRNFRGRGRGRRGGNRNGNWNGGRGNGGGRGRNNSNNGFPRPQPAGP
ncbi:unnamed protein product [Phytophthora lilii]|uniref:Unnamed protein product n=1 Tax=Phytophthora lilii TaxID=2077276 RepID=A0A9W6WRJ5_9STRA|nr:unnamed protein product [Phytophthora lilii]